VPVLITNYARPGDTCAPAALDDSRAALAFRRPISCVRAGSIFQRAGNNSLARRSSSVGARVEQVEDLRKMSATPPRRFGTECGIADGGEEMRGFQPEIVRGLRTVGHEMRPWLRRLHSRLEAP